jgi:glycosyltransferase involved in cell wall biosynthesis
MKRNYNYNIVIWSSAIGFGGAEKRLVEYCLDLKNYGCSVYLLVKQKSILYKKLVEKNIANSENCVSTPFGSVDLIGILRVVFRVKKWKGDILHVHSGKDYFSAILVGILSGCPVIVHRRILAPLNWATKLVGNLKNVRYIACSLTVKNILVKKNKISPRKIKTIYSIPKIEKFEAKDYEIDNVRKNLSLCGKKVILNIANFYPTKRHRDLVYVVNILKNKIPNIVLIIIGRRTSETKRVEKMIEKFGLSENIKILGYQQNVEIFYHICDCFVMLSDEEAFGAVFVESIAFWKPVVAYSSGGAKEIIKDKVTGFLVPVGNVELVSEKIFEILTDDNLRNSMSKNAREDYNERFLSKNITEETLEYYDEIIKLSKNNPIRKLGL